MRNPHSDHLLGRRKVKQVTRLNCGFADSLAYKKGIEWRDCCIRPPVNRDFLAEAGVYFRSSAAVKPAWALVMGLFNLRRPSSVF